jgi:protein SCO1
VIGCHGYTGRMKNISARGRIGTTSLFVIAAIAVAIGLWAGSRWLSVDTAPRLETAVMYPARLAIPDFQLQRANSEPFTAADLKGHWTIAFFGFTHCPDVCPTTLAAFKQVWSRLHAAGRTDQAQFAFISVDPERDTPEQLGNYVGYFNKDFIAATGADEQLRRLTRALGLVYAKVPDQSGGYSVDHSASAVIIDPQGRRAGLFRPPFAAEAISADIIALTESQ